MAATPVVPTPQRRARPNAINEDNRLTQSITGDNVVTDYRYDAQGTRRVKYSRVYGETLYADRMYQEHVGTTSTAAVTKHIFVGQTRIAGKLHYTDQTPSTRALYMQQNTFWYHTRCVPQPQVLCEERTDTGSLRQHQLGD